MGQEDVPADDVRNDDAYRCPRCGSDRVIPDLALQDHFGDVGAFSKDAQVEVHGVPKAWVFKETATGTLSLTVCGDCGHAELSVSNFRELYERYQKARGETTGGL